VLKTKLSLLALSLAIWWVTINVTWISIGDSGLTGGELAPALNLAPAIAITALFIAAYGRLVRALLVMVSLVSGVAAYFTVATDWAQSGAVISILERISGVMNADQHAAGVAIEHSPMLYASALVATLASALAIWAIFAARQPTPSRASEETGAIDNRSLWDEQG
jgi:hypothetical protein